MIRKAIQKDLGEIIHINNFVDYGNPDNFLLESISKDKVFVYEERNKLVGFALYQIMWGNTPFLSLVKIHPDYQGKGIGTLLLRGIEQEIKEKGFSEYLSSTIVSNKLAKRFHSKLGFYQIGELEMPHGPELFYRKDF